MGFGKANNDIMVWKRWVDGRPYFIGAVHFALDGGMHRWGNNQVSRDFSSSFLLLID